MSRQSRQAKKNTQGKPEASRFTLKMQKKLLVLFVLILLAFAGLSARLIWITREDGERYKKQVLSQRRYDSTTIPYRRGDIVDAKGTKLATSEKVYNLIIDAKIINSDPDYMEPTMAALEANFELDMGKIREHVTNNPTSPWYVARKRLTYDEISGFQAQALEDKKIKGVWFEEEYKRVYPNSALACDVIGFTSSDNVGTYGMEEYYNTTLNGTAGREYGYLNEDGTLERTVKPAVDGNTIHSTIDVNIQSIVEKYLKQYNDEHKDEVRAGNGANNLGCIIMEVDTGNVLAMASYPNFDLNNPRDLSAYYSEEQIAEMEANDTFYDTLNQLWRNFCISDTFEPGSTAKPFTVAGALEAGAITGNEVYLCEGKLNRGGHDIRCHVRSGEGNVDVQSAIAWSCNVALMHIGEALGKEDFCKFQETFNFGLKTNIDLAGEARTVGLLYNAENMKEADLATNTFGQNFNVTMIQMISAFCSLINGGYYYEPHMVSRITNSSGATVENMEPRVLRQTISESTSEKIRQYCRATVMEEGGDARTGKKAKPPGYAIGGKTGTAQTLPRGNKEYIVSFMGYAPADDPQIAIYVVIDRPNLEKQDQAGHACQITRSILMEVLPYLNIFMTEELTQEEIQELEAKQLEVTNMYTQTPEEDALDGLEDEEAGADGVSQGNQPVWMGYETDPETGHKIDPETGEHLDPETGEPVEGNYNATEYEGLPDNGNIDDNNPL